MTIKARALNKIRRNPSSLKMTLTTQCGSWGRILRGCRAKMGPMWECFRQGWGSIHYQIWLLTLLKFWKIWDIRRIKRKKDGKYKERSRLQSTSLLAMTEASKWHRFRTRPKRKILSLRKYLKIDSTRVIKTPALEILIWLWTNHFVSWKNQTKMKSSRKKVKD